MQFSVLHGIKLMIERMPLEAANEALQRIESAAPRFRIVFDATNNRSAK